MPSFLVLSVVVLAILSRSNAQGPKFNPANWDEHTGQLVCKTVVDRLTSQNATAAHFVDPLLHDCFNKSWYNVDQLPMKPGVRFKQLELKFDFQFKVCVSSVAPFWILWKFFL